MNQPKLQELARYDSAEYYNQPLRCFFQFQISWICVNPKCQLPSLSCGNDDCQECKQHSRCKILKLKPIQKDIAELLRYKKELREGFRNIVSEITHNLQEDPEQSFDISFGGEFVEQTRAVLFQKKDGKLIGKDSEELVNQLQIKLPQMPLIIKTLLGEFDKKSKQMVYELKTMRKQLYSTFDLCNNSQKGKIADGQSQKRQIQPYQCFSNEDYSLQASLTEKQHQFLVKSLGGICQFRHLFRASEHGFKAASFHEKCDNIKNTLTLVKTEFGNIFAGFTSYTWNEAINGHVWEKKNTFKKEAFLISFENMEKRIPNDGNTMIYCYRGYGPCFGNFDLCITDQCHKFRDSYECRNKYLSKGEKSQNTGTINEFRVHEYDVYQVIFK